MDGYTLELLARSGLRMQWMAIPWNYWLQVPSQREYLITSWVSNQTDIQLYWLKSLKEQWKNYTGQDSPEYIYLNGKYIHKYDMGTAVKINYSMSCTIICSNWSIVSRVFSDVAKEMSQILIERKNAWYFETDYVELNIKLIMKK